MTQMNPRELDVLNILWKSDEPMTSTDIVNEQKGLTHGYRCSSKAFKGRAR